MAYDPDQRRRALQEFMDEYSLSARKLSGSAGLSPSAVTQFLKGHSRSLTDETYELLAYGASDLLGWKVAPAHLRGEIPLKVPVYETGIVVLKEIEPRYNLPDLMPYIEWGVAWSTAPRFPPIRTRQGVFAIMAPDNRMEPWREADQLIYAEKLRPPRFGDYAIFEFKALEVGSSSYTPALIGRVVSRSLAGYEAIQWWPDREKRFVIERKNLHAAHRVIDWSELVLGDEYLDGFSG